MDKTFYPVRICVASYALHVGAYWEEKRADDPGRDAVTIHTQNTYVNTDFGPKDTLGTLLETELQMDYGDALVTLDVPGHAYKIGWNDYLAVQRQAAIDRRLIERPADFAIHVVPREPKWTKCIHLGKEEGASLVKRLAEAVLEREEPAKRARVEITDDSGDKPSEPVPPIDL